MKRDFKPAIDESKIGINPFTQNLKIPVNELISDKYLSKERYGDELITVPAELEYEACSYSKIFLDAARRKRVTELTARAKDLLMWIIYELEAGKDWIWLNKGRYMNENRVNSVNTYKSALKELISSSFISATQYTNTYWINPDIMFNGSRIKKFPNNLVYKKK